VLMTAHIRYGLQAHAPMIPEFSEFLELRVNVARKEIRDWRRWVGSGSEATSVPAGVIFRIPWVKLFCIWS
jgi:hypothetical protein